MSLYSANGVADIDCYALAGIENMRYNDSGHPAAESSHAKRPWMSISRYPTDDKFRWHSQSGNRPATRWSATQKKLIL